MVSPVAMYGCETWIIKKAEHWRNDAFELLCWRRLLRVSSRSNQSILKEISTEYSLKGLMLKLKLQFFGHLMWRTDSLEKTLMLGKEEKGRTEDEMAGWHHRLGGREFEWTVGVGDEQGGLVCCDSWGHKELDMTELPNWAPRQKCWHAGVPHRLRCIWSTIDRVSWQANQASSMEIWGVLVFPPFPGSCNSVVIFRLPAPKWIVPLTITLTHSLLKGNMNLGLDTGRCIARFSPFLSRIIQTLVSWSSGSEGHRGWFPGTSSTGLMYRPQHQGPSWHAVTSAHWHWRVTCK